MCDLAAWSWALACPVCSGRLAGAGSLSMRCAGCGGDFPVRAGIPSLVHPSRRAWADGFGKAYREARLLEGWAPPDAAQALALPDHPPPRHPALYWEIRRQSLAVLERAIADSSKKEMAGAELPLAADLGAGTGWLSYRLALAGYRSVAIDASVDDGFGVGAMAPYRHACPGRILALQGDLEHPPLAASAYALVVFNASLHYATDLTGTLARGARALAPGGLLAVMDSPVERLPRAGHGHGDRHLGRAELDHALAAAGLRPRWLDVPRSAHWMWHQLKATLRGHERFTFPLVLAEP